MHLFYFLFTLNLFLSEGSKQEKGHVCVHHIPGTTATYEIDHSFVGGLFCLSPSEHDNEVLDDIPLIKVQTF